MPSLRRRAPINFAKIPSCIYVPFFGTPRLSFVRYDTRPVVNQSSYSHYFGFTTSILPLHWLAPLRHITPRALGACGSTMDDGGLGDIVESDADVVESCTTREKKFTNDDAHLEPT